jgi:hypothetical protein
MGRLAAAIVAGVGVGGCAGADAPTLDSASPASATRGGAVVLRGDGFCVPDCESSPAGTVDFGVEIPQIRAVVVAWDATAIQVVVPQMVDTGPTEIVVTVNDRTSNAIDFEVLP